MSKFFSKEEKGNYNIYNFFGVKLKLRKVSNNKILLVNSRGGGKSVRSVKGLNVEFAGSNSTVIIHTPILKFKDSKIFLRSNCKVEIGYSQHEAKKLDARLLGDNQQLKIGNNFSCTNSCLILFSKEENISIEVGNDCMFASNIVLRPSDGHTIANKTTGEVLNYGKDIKIKDNVWIAMNSTVLKGVTIEKGCVIGTGSIVTKPCTEENAIYVGSPARKIKSNIIWDRDAIPDFLEKTR